MNNIYRVFVTVCMIPVFSLLTMSTSGYAQQPTVTVRLDPDIRTLIAGYEPKEIKITTLTNKSGVQFVWGIDGKGKIEEKDPNSGILYTPPATIANKSWATITVVVTDAQERTAEDSVTFTLIPQPDTEGDKELGKKKTINTLLREADSLFKRKRFLTPPEENAFDLYAAVLRLSPQNEQALRKIHQMMEFYQTRGNNYYEQSQNFARAKDYYEKYLIIATYLNIQETIDTITKRLEIITFLEEAGRIFDLTQFSHLPKASEFEAYKNDVEKAVQYYQKVLAIEPQNSYALSQLRNIIDRNASWGDYAYKYEWFTTPKGKSAFDYYQIVLKINPQHQEARERMRKIAQAYKKRGDSDYAKGERDEAKEWYDRYLLVAGYVLHELNDFSIETEYQNVRKLVSSYE